MKIKTSLTKVVSHTKDRLLQSQYPIRFSCGESSPTCNLILSRQIRYCLFIYNTALSSFLNEFKKPKKNHKMSSKFSYSEPHICQCLTRLSTLRSDDVVTITGNRQKTGKQFADEVLCLARGLLQLGVATGDIVAISAFNRFSL